VEVGCLAPSAVDLDVVAARVAIRFTRDESRRGMQGLMDVASEMQHPGEVIGFHVVGSKRRGQRFPEQSDLGLRIREGGG
jgi:hypothetical protein